ncbi:MAG: DMT family transporter [Chthoniobacterales bacterium]
MSSNPKSSSSLINYLLLCSIGFFWGFQYLLTKIALESFSIGMITLSRIVLGFILLTPWLFIIESKEKSRPILKNYFWKYLPVFILIGFLEQTLPWSLVAWAEQQIPSSFTAILIGTVPLFATFLEVFFINDHEITTEKTVAIIIGLLGIFVLVGPKMFGVNIIDSLSLSLPVLPVCAMLLAAVSFSISILLIKVKLTPKLSPIKSGHGIFTGALVTSLPLYFLSTTSWKTSCFFYSNSALISLLLLGIISSGGIVYLLYVMLISKAGPSFASAANYISLTVATFIGLTFRGERLSFNVIGGALLVLVALWLLRDKRV